MRKMVLSGFMVLLFCFTIVFGGSLVDDDFDHYDSVKWQNLSDLGNELYVQDGVLKEVSPGGGNAKLHSNNWFISGDFDIRVNYGLASYDTTNTWNVNIRAMIENEDTLIQMGRGFYGGEGDIYRHSYKIAGGSWNSDFVTTPHSAGKFRITRTGSYSSAYYWSGSNWVKVGNSVDIGTGNITIELDTMSWNNNPAISAEFDNFKVVAGNVHNVTIPFASSFTSFPGTTNFSQVENLSAVENLTLGSPHGTISFGNNTVNAEAQDYDKNIVFGDCFVAVNASDLDYTFNATAYLLMNNSDGHCGDDTIFVTSQVVADAGAVKTGAKICTDCKTISVGGDSVTFRVPHFSSYAIGSNSNITIDANDPKQVNETVLFTAVYRNSSSGNFISGANCQIDVPTGSYAMNEGADKYTYQTLFEQNATYEYNVTCSKTGYNTLQVEDSFQILPSGEAVPEFSAIAILLLLVSVIAAVYFAGKK